ncbi:hypothetical protein RMCBS344292_18139 [Rhizopus microsporus]|nr:hypothetical protein RMCBS344292_18139 [Rhizopus microsporus]
MLGKVYYFGTRDIPRDYAEAIKYFKQIADKKLLTSANRKKEESKILGQAAGYLGLMHWRGEGVPASVKHAYEWFKFGLMFDDPASQNAIGLMYKNGIGIDKDQRYALHYFKAAASQNHPDAMVNLALEYAQDDITLPTAIDLLTKAAEKEHLLAYWYLGQLNDQGYSSSRSCRVAVHYYKAISEIGDWLHPTVEQGYNAYKQGDHESALLFYTLAAERGYEVSQSNVAYLLDPDKRVWDFRSLFTKQEKPRDIEGERTAFTYWSRAAHQSNIDARVKMCDYYFKGIGTKADPEKAAACYRNAAENGRSSLAYWNLGWMYENGIGVKQDFPLAKRAYDNALATWPDAYLPVKLSLLSCLRKWWWHRMTSKDQ